MSKLTGTVKSHPVVTTIMVVLVLAAGGAAYAYWSMNRVDSSVVYFSVPDAPRLTANGPDQTVYRIDASRSSVTYEATEKLAGADHTANGTTKGIAGDILIDDANPSASQVGQMVVNVQQLTSDQKLRDARIRHDFLESDRYPLANFTTKSISGLPDEIVDGTQYKVTLDGDLTVKTTTAPATLEATASRANGELKITASTTVKMSTFKVGPINLIGLVSTGDDVKLTFDLTAPEASKVGDKSQLAWQPSQAQQVASGPSPSFAREVQPILEESCASCHQPNGPGASIWQLETAGDASKVANGLGLVVQSRYMPPWLATDKGIPLQHSPVLSDDQVNTIARWASAGGQLDVDPSTPVKASVDNYPRPRADQVLTADAPYQGSTDLTNDYRCFVLDPGITQTKVITGYEFQPDQVPVVHHALVYKLDAKQMEQVRKRDADDPGTGYECFGGVGGGDIPSPTGAGGGTELVAGWAPGNQPALFPEGSGLVMEPGEFFVIQIHYHFAHNAPADRSRLVLQYGDKDVSSYDRIRVNTYLAPAEIPCLPDQSGPLCDRNNVIAQLQADYGPGAPLIANGLNLICGTTPQQLGVLDGTIARASCTRRVSQRGEIISVLGHMHEIGKTFRMTLNPGTPEEKILLDIDRWDFNWQLNYAPVEKIELKRGDTIKVECSWDRSLVKPGTEPRYVTWNEGTEDEMCYSTVATREPATP